MLTFLSQLAYLSRVKFGQDIKESIVRNFKRLFVVNSFSPGVRELQDKEDAGAAGVRYKGRPSEMEL